MTTTITAPKVGAKVSVDHPKHPGVWTIKSIGRVNAVLEHPNGGRDLRAPLSMLIEPQAGVTVTAIPVEQKVFFDVGEFVRIPSGKFEGLYVVIADKGLDRVNVAKLGGDHGRYVRAGRSSLVKVDPADVLA